MCGQFKVRIDRQKKMSWIWNVDITDREHAKT